MRDSYSFQIPRHPPINRKRKPFGYVNELSEADSQHWSLRNNIERALPDSYPGVVVWIGLIAIQKFGDQRGTEDDDGYQSCQARSQPDLAPDGQGPLQQLLIEIRPSNPPIDTARN